MHLKKVGHQRRVLLGRPGHDFGFDVIGQNGIGIGISFIHLPDRLPLKDNSPRPIPTMVAATNHWRGSRSSKPGVVRARASPISAVSELSSLFARKSKPKFKPKLESMTAVVAGKLLFHFLPSCCRCSEKAEWRRCFVW